MIDRLQSLRCCHQFRLSMLTNSFLLYGSGSHTCSLSMLNLQVSIIINRGKNQHVFFTEWLGLVFNANVAMYGTNCMQVENGHRLSVIRVGWENTRDPEYSLYRI